MVGGAEIVTKGRDEIVRSTDQRNRAAIAMACAPAAEVPTPTFGNLQTVRDGDGEDGDVGRSVHRSVTNVTTTTPYQRTDSGTGRLVATATPSTNTEARATIRYVVRKPVG